MSDALELQEADVIAETPADTYHSTNAVYACAALSYLSVGC